MEKSYQTIDEEGKPGLKELTGKYVLLVDRVQFLAYKKRYLTHDFISTEYAKASEEMESVKKAILEIINKK